MKTNTAVIARFNRATQYSRGVEINRDAAAYWIARSSRATTVLFKQKNPATWAGFQKRGG